MMHIVNNKNPPKVPDDISPEARDFLERCWERDPFRRPNCDRLLAHPFIRGATQRPSTAPDASLQTPRVHPTVGAHPSPIQEEAGSHDAHDQRKTPEKPQRAHLPHACTCAAPCTLLSCCGGHLTFSAPDLNLHNML